MRAARARPGPRSRRSCATATARTSSSCSRTAQTSSSCAATRARSGRCSTSRRSAPASRSSPTTCAPAIAAGLIPPTTSSTWRRRWSARRSRSARGCSTARSPTPSARRSSSPGSSSRASARALVSGARNVCCADARTATSMVATLSWFSSAPELTARRPTQLPVLRRRQRSTRIPMRRLVATFLPIAALAAAALVPASASAPSPWASPTSRPRPSPTRSTRR